MAADDDGAEALRGGAALVAVGGLVATGKSTLARRVADDLRASVVEADATRNRLLRSAAARDEQPVLDPGTDANYADVLARVREALDAGGPVIVDGCFGTRRWRRAARRLAASRGIPFLFVECRTDRAVSRAWLRRRARERGDDAEAWLRLYRDFEALFEPVDELPGHEHLPLDTTCPADRNAQAVLDRMGRRRDER